MTSSNNKNPAQKHSDILDRDMLNDIRRAITTGAEMSDAERQYAIRVMNTVIHLVWDDYDIFRIYRTRQKEKKYAFKELATLVHAQRAGRGIKEAWELIDAERVNRKKGYHSLFESINYIKAVWGLNEDQAIKAYATRHNRDIDSIDRQYKRVKKRKKQGGGVTP